MATFYGMNGKAGRAKTMRSIRKEQAERAKAAGIDTTDRKAMKAFLDAEFWSRHNKFMADLAAKRVP